MKLFTADIDKKLFAQYLKGSDLANQVVVAKIFNPYGRGTWYLLNSDPEDPEYLWAIVDMDDIEVGSVNRSDLENIRIKPFMLGLERDLSFTPMNAAKIYRGLNSGKTYAKGGGVTMKHPKSYYQDLPSYSGYKWVGFDKGKHIFQKKEAKGYSVIEALESDLTNGNIEFMAEHGLTNTNKKATGGGVGNLKKGYIVKLKNKSIGESGYIQGQDGTAKLLEDKPNEYGMIKAFYFGEKGFNGVTAYLGKDDIEKIIKYKDGGAVGEYKLNDNVDFYYGRADEKKVISGTISDILNDGYTISTGFTQVMVKPNEIVGYSKEAEPKKKRFGIFKDGGGVGKNVIIQMSGSDQMGLWHIIDAEPPFSYSTEVFFDNKEEAKKFADKKGFNIVKKFENKYADGGGVGLENKEMVLNNNKQIAHHTEELSEAVRKSKYVPAWVVAKVNRSASDLSDATHYMEGENETYATGGGVQQPSYAIKLSELLNKYEPTLIGISRGMVQVTPSMAYSGAELSNMFKGFGDSMDIKNIVYRSLRDKESYPIVEKLTKGKYKLIKPTWSDNFEDYYFDNITKKEKGGGTKKEFIAKKVGKVMREFKEGDLHIGTSNKIVKNPKQAIAIALSEGKRGWKHKK